MPQRVFHVVRRPIRKVMSNPRWGGAAKV
jgi:hypothetical protein